MKKEEIAYNKGYFVVDSIVYNKKGLIIRQSFNQSGYFKFNIWYNKILTISVHRLVAYQKYKEFLYKDGIEVRHFDGNPLNNSYDNILLGTHQQNMMDIKEDVRLKASVKASEKLRKFTDLEMDVIRSDKSLGYTYKELMLKYNISSKGTLHYILNTTYKTKII